MGGKRDQRLRKRAEGRKIKSGNPRPPYRDIGSMAALSAHDRLTATFLSGVRDRRGGNIPPEEVVARMAYLRGIVFAIKVLKEEMKSNNKIEVVTGDGGETSD